MPCIRKILEVAYHRNGGSGLGFYAVRFTVTATGKGNGKAGDEMLATVFEESGAVAVISPALLPERGVAFGRNSWRGDEYEPELRAAIAKYQESLA